MSAITVGAAAAQSSKRCERAQWQVRSAVCFENPRSVDRPIVHRTPQAEGVGGFVWIFGYCDKTFWCSREKVRDDAIALLFCPPRFSLRRVLRSRRTNHMNLSENSFYARHLAQDKTPLNVGTFLASILQCSLRLATFDHPYSSNCPRLSVQSICALSQGLATGSVGERMVE